MLYHLLYPFHTEWFVFNVFKYITFRTIYATITALLLTMVLGPWFIRKVSELKMGEIIRHDGPQSHLQKKGTPTMGGVLIVGSVLLSTLLWANLTNQFVWMAILVTMSFSLIGFVDDFMKLKKGKGISARAKFFAQIIVALGVSLYLAFVDLEKGFDRVPRMYYGGP